MRLLSRPFRDEFNKFEVVESGAQPSPPTAEECVTKSESLFGFATGMLYVKERGGKEAKDEVNTENRK